MAGPRVRARAILVALLAIALVAAAALALTARGGGAQMPPRSEAEKPKLLLLTSLPLIFPEQFALDGGGSPALDALESRYRVEPIGVADTSSLASGRLLLMAHPLAQPAEALVELDTWVRRGGNVLILADPRLEWPSALPLGHIHRPPPYFADTGLLRHWGLRLEPPDTPGPVGPIIDGREVRTMSVGMLGTTGGNCLLSAHGLIARCSIGAGKATIIADADFLNLELVEGAGGAGNLDFLLTELARLER